MKDLKKLAEEIESFIEGFSESYESPTITVRIDVYDKTCTIHISKMYEGLGRMTSFKALSGLADKLGTDEINLENEDYRSGCDSCDWGSEHSVDIVCKNINL
jgi:hypothetical protein